MGKCNKSAVLMPEYLCHETVHKLRKQGHDHVFIGKEVYSNVSPGNGFYGGISNLLQLRVIGSETAGLWKWWNQFVEDQYFTGSNTDVVRMPVRPSMKHMAGYENSISNISPKGFETSPLQKYMKHIYQTK